MLVESQNRKRKNSRARGRVCKRVNSRARGAVRTLPRGAECGCCSSGAARRKRRRQAHPARVALSSPCHAARFDRAASASAASQRARSERQGRAGSPLPAARKLGGKICAKRPPCHNPFTGGQGTARPTRASRHTAAIHSRHTFRRTAPELQASRHTAAIHSRNIPAHSAGTTGFAPYCRNPFAPHSGAQRRNYRLRATLPQTTRATFRRAAPELQASRPTHSN